MHSKVGAAKHTIVCLPNKEISRVTHNMRKKSSRMYHTKSYTDRLNHWQIDRPARTFDISTTITQDEKNKKIRNLRTLRCSCNNMNTSFSTSHCDYFSSTAPKNCTISCGQLDGEKRKYEERNIILRSTSIKKDAGHLLSFYQQYHSACGLLTL